MTTQTLTPEELAFIAEGSLVGVVPTVPVEELHLLSGTVGPLMPQVPARVPLWLAVYLAKRNQCVLKPPEWLSRKSLEDLLAAERALGNEAFGVLPSEGFVETATLYLEHGKETIADSERVRQLVEAIVDCRKVKVLEGLSTLTGPTVLIKLDNLTRLELNVLRPFLLRSMKQFDLVGGEQPQRQQM